MSSLSDALHSYAALDLDFSERLRRLEADFGMRVGKTALAKLNKQFGVRTPRPRASSFSSPSPSSNDGAMSSSSHKAANRISSICDELSSEKPTRASDRHPENAHKRKLDTENVPIRRKTLGHLQARSISKPAPIPSPQPAPTHNRWWYAQHADLKLELVEMKAGFALDVLKRKKAVDKAVLSVNPASTVRRPFGELSRPILLGN